METPPSITGSGSSGGGGEAAGVGGDVELVSAAMAAAAAAATVGALLDVVASDGKVTAANAFDVAALEAAVAAPKSTKVVDDEDEGDGDSSDSSDSESDVEVRRGVSACPPTRRTFWRQ